MVRTLNRLWPRKKKKKIIVYPVNDSWETWDLSADPIFLGSQSDKPTISDPLVVLPVRHVFAVPLWLLSTDTSLFPEMIFSQLERSGLPMRNREETVMDYHIVSSEETQTQILAVILPATLPENLSFEKADQYEVSAHLFKMPSDQIVLWREGDRLAMAVTRGENLAYFQSLGDPEIIPSVVKELRTIQLNLEAQRIFTASGVTLWGDFSEDEQSLLTQDLSLPLTNQSRPPPQWPAQPWNLMPLAVKNAKATNEKRVKKMEIVFAAAAVYLLIMLAVISNVSWLGYQHWKIQRSIKKNTPTIDTINQTEAKWRTFQLALDQDLWPLEILLRIQKLIPESIRMTQFELGESGKITIKGESKDSKAISQFNESLVKNSDLNSFQWKMEPPRSSKNGTGFIVIGTPSYASTR